MHQAPLADSQSARGRRPNMRKLAGIIDVHHHIVPQDYVETLARHGITKALGAPFPRWSGERSLTVMDASGIAAASVSLSAPGVYCREAKNSPGLARELARRTNDQCARLIASYPARFGAFATLPLPDIDSALAELERALDALDLDGLILLSNYDGHYLGDACFEPLMAELDRRSAVVFIHPSSCAMVERPKAGLTEAMLEPCFETTRTAFSLIVNGTLRRFPGIRFILAHAGGTVPYLAARVGMTTQLLAEAKGAGPAIGNAVASILRRYPGLKRHAPDLLRYFVNVKENVLPEGPDNYLARFYYDTALSASPHALSSLQSLVDSDRILFGSDFPFATSAAIPLTVEGLLSYARFKERDLERIGAMNALELFPRLASRRARLLEGRANGPVASKLD